MACKNSSPNYKANRAKMVANYNRMLSYLTVEQRAKIPRDWMHRRGISADFQPVELSFTGDIKGIKWPIIDSQTGGNIRQRIVERCDVAVLRSMCDIFTGENIKNMFTDRARPGSCMNYDFARPWLSIYADNPSDVDGIAFTSWLIERKTCSWLRWKGNRTNFFGKVYVCCDAQLIAAIRNRLESVFGVVPGIPAPVTFRLRWQGERLPYMDEYQYCKDFSESDASVTLSRKSENDNHGIVRDHQNGWHPTEDPEPRNSCESCGCNCDDDDIYHIGNDTYCPDCVGYCEWSEESVPSDCIDRYSVYANGRTQDLWISEDSLSSDFIRSDFSSSGDVDWVEDCEIIDLPDCRQCSPDYDDLCHDVDGEPLLSDDAVECETDSETYCADDDRICQVDDAWYLKTDDDVCQVDDAWYLKTDDRICQVDDAWYLKTDLVVA